MSELPSSFSTLFGPIDHADGNEARSVLSPSAYLVDLLMLTESSGYHARRPDIRQIPLDHASTFTEVPQLGIANEVMGALVPPAELGTRLYPPPLPFSEQAQRLGLYAEELGTSLDELWRLYAEAPDGRLSARLLLGLSEEELSLYSTSHASAAAIAELWGATAAEVSALQAGDVALIKKKLRVSLKELKSLVRQDLSAEELARSTANPAERFFVNQSSDYLRLFEDREPAQLRLKSDAGLTLQHLDRLMRFVRLARRLELSFPELDWLLQTTCRQGSPSSSIVLDEKGLQALAVALGLRKLGELEVDDLCSLWGPVKSHGRGDGAVPSDLSSRVYDNGFPGTLAALVDKLASSGANADALDERLQATLRLSGADFLYLKRALSARGVAQPVLVLSQVVAYFSALRRIVRLAALLLLDVREVVALLDVLGAQWTVSNDHDLAVLAPFHASSQALDPLERLIQPDVPPHQTLDVLQKIVRVKAWLDARQLSARQLAFICLADHAEARARLDDGSPIDDVQPDDAVATTLEDLHQSLLDLLVAPGALQTGSLTASGAQAVFESLLQARVLVTFADPTRALLRVLPTAEELAAAMQRGIEERLELHGSDLAALGITDIELLFAALVSYGYVERRDEVVAGEIEVHHFLAPGLAAYFEDPSSADTFTLPSFQAQSEALFSALQQQLDAPRIAPSLLVAAGVEAEDIGTLFGVLLARGYVVAVGATTPVEYRVSDEAKAFFQDVANLPRFVLPDFSAAFAALAAKVAAYRRADANRSLEALELEGRLSASAEQATQLWLRTLAGFLGLSEDVTAQAAAWAFGTPDERLERSLATAAEALFRAKGRGRAPLSDAYLGSRFCRLQQLALLLRKTAMSADEARVYLDNQALHRRLPETLRVPTGFLESGRVDALTTLPSGDFLIVSGPRYATFDRVDYRRRASGTLDQIPGVTLSGPFRDRVLAEGIDAAFSDTDLAGEPVLHLCSRGEYVTVTRTGTSAPRPITDWGRVRNNIQQNARVDAAVQDPAGHLFLFSGDQYVRYDDPLALLAGAAGVDERYPRSIRGKFAAEGLTPVPAAMFSKVDAAFRDANDRYYFFSGNRFTHSDTPYQLRKIRPVWGHVLNYLFEENRVDAAFVIGDATYFTRKNQLTRYTGSEYRFVDERFPITFGNIAESEPLLRVLRRFPNGLAAALAGSDGLLYAFANGQFASSAEPDTSLSIRDHWGLVRNVFIDHQRVDGALFHDGITYLYCGDQYVRYSTPSYDFVDEGYPKRVHANWNDVEHVGTLPASLPLPVTAVVVGRAPGGATDDVYFFAGNQYAGPSGAIEDIEAHWARVRNNIERVGVVDAALLDGSGRMYLFSGDQLYRYTSPEQPFVDETYPRRLAGNWAQEGAGYSLPETFASGISAALRAGDGRIYFFSGTSYARVDASPALAPRANAQDWGVVRNWIQSQNRVSSAFVDPSGTTYLFGGDQFVRYSNASDDFADEGYPLAIGTRWGNLPASFRAGIDASLVFRSPVDNVQRLYLFKDGYYVRYSTSNYAQVDAGYPKRLRDGISAEGHWFKGFAVHDPNPFGPDEWIEEIEATYVDTHNNQPRLYVFYKHGGPTQWRREYRNGNWSPPVSMHHVDDYEPFNRLDAAFVSADGTLHAFCGEQYASRARTASQMTPPVPVRSRWARVRNQFAELGRVDASLSMADGRTYLFCASQYIKYTGALRPGQADFYVDEGYPRRVDPSWPSEGIALALAAESQPTGYDLCRDAAGKIHFFNGSRYDFSGNTEGDAGLSSRWGKVKNRFHELDRVDGAYRAENGKLYLFCDTQLTRYSGSLEPGSSEFYADEGYPRTISTWWAAEGLEPAMPATWNAEGSAVFRAAEQTYVFDGASFISSEVPAPAPVIPHWARVRNELQTQNRVDAGFVHGQGASAVTLVFAADQYVRYSGAYDGFVDEGYPKVIAHLAAADGVFPGIPTELLPELRGFIAGKDGNLHVFGPPPADAAAPQLHVSSAAGSALRPLNERWGIVDNQLWDNEHVDAALHTADGKLVLFSGDQFLRYSGSDRSHVDEGYPRKISTSYAEELGVPALAPVLNDGVDAALVIGTTHFYFARDQYVSSAQPLTALPLVAHWGRVDNHLQQSERLDAAFVAPNGKLYLFAQNQYAVYSGKSREYVDEEFPRVMVSDIGAEWPQLPRLPRWLTLARCADRRRCPGALLGRGHRERSHLRAGVPVTG